MKFKNESWSWLLRSLAPRKESLMWFLSYFLPRLGVAILIVWLLFRLGVVR